MAKKIEEWKEKGLYIFFIPPCCPHLNIAETVWRKLKTKWLCPEHYRSKQILHETTHEILSKIGSDEEAWSSNSISSMSLRDEIGSIYESAAAMPQLPNL